MKQIKRRGIMSFVFFSINAAGLLALGSLIGYGAIHPEFQWQRLLLQLFIGFLTGSILIIPLHELLHGLAYVVMGARRIRFGMDMTQWIFYVTAHEYPIRSWQILVLALTPFAVINASALSIGLLFFPAILPGILVFLMAHNLMCIGDFAIANYTLKASGLLYSYDDVKLKVSYFFSRS